MPHLIVLVVVYGLSGLGWVIIGVKAVRLVRALWHNLVVLRKVDKALLRLRYPFQADRWPDWMHRLHFLPLSWVVPLARRIDDQELALMNEADEQYEARRQAAWDRYFAEHPEVLASHSHQNGGWPHEHEEEL